MSMVISEAGQTRPSDLLTVNETAALFGQHPRTIRRKLAAGEIPGVQLGGPKTAIRIPRAELERWLHAEAGE